MSIFRPEVDKNEKDIKQHPWARRIKDHYSSRIKTAHNSINNPKYPFKKGKQPASDRVKFTIIGDRVTKEFTYCTNLIKGLHKYRWRNFETPVIRGVNTVEWPAIWNDLKIRYGGLAFCLKSSVAVLLNDKIIGGEKELKELVESKYIYHLCLDYYNEGVAEFVKFVKSSGRPCAYMHLSVDREHIGTLIFMLYADLVPYTCDNFLRLCNTKRGGYSGTSVHRIVKDCWIQCGGFGLKSTPLDCENFIIPHDKRGVLGMANNGRHEDCSTQFFVLLQPASWMEHKYVAFGQLIEGEATLKKIESVKTWYESPTSEITIYQCGILNMECHDIMINRGTNEYISGHMEDLNALGELLWEALLENVFLNVQLREIELMKEQYGEGGSHGEAESGIRATQRFNRKKEEIEKHIEKSQVDTQRFTTTDENNDFDVEEYEYEPDEIYMHQSIYTPSLVVKPEKIYYLPLTDVPYPGEVDSNFDLKRFLQGDYCLESDLQKDTPKKCPVQENLSFLSDIFYVPESETISENSLDSDEERELRKYLKSNMDHVSFAGGVVKHIAKNAAGKLNMFKDRSKMISDDDLRRFRMAASDHEEKNNRCKTVSISVPPSEKETHNKIKRRQTGFVRPEDLEKIHVFHKTSENDMFDDESAADMARKVHMAPSALNASPSGPRPSRRPTGFVRGHDAASSDVDVHRPSVLARLYDDVTCDEHGPTLKDYNHPTSRHMNLLQTYSPNSRIKSDDESTRDKYMRHSLLVESLEHILNLQHGKKVTRKISSDYVKTIDHIEQRLENSIRSIEYAKTRPAISVSEYQMKNKKYQEGLKIMSEAKVPKNFDKLTF